MHQSPDMALRPYLGDDEKLLWSGQPQQGLMLRAQDIFLIPFSVMWCGFAIFWEVMALTQMPEQAGAMRYFFPLWGLPFVMMGLYFVIGRFWHDAARRARTYYGITPDHIVIVGGLFSRTVKMLQMRTLTDISLNPKPDGSGTITFGAVSPMLVSAPQVPGLNPNAAPSSEAIERAREVYDIIRAAQKKAL